MLNDMITVTPAFLGKLMITLKCYDSSIVISLACSRLQDSSRKSRSKKLRKNRVGWGGLGGTGKWTFWYTLWFVIFWQFTSTLMSNIWLHERQGKQTWRAVKPSSTAHFALRNGFRFLAPCSSLCFLSFLPQTSSLSSFFSRFLPF